MTIPITNKKEQLSKFRADMLNKSLTMFEWKNLPDTLPAVEIEKQLQTNGYSIIAKVKGNIYAFQGGFSGQDPYNQPTTAIVNNPSLKYNGTFTINENCVIIKNDDMQQGLIHIYNKYGTLLIENQITMLMTDYNYRMPFTISSKDDSTTHSAREYLQKVIDGSLGVIGEAKLFDALKVTPTNNKGVNSFADLYGYQQFIEAQLNNTIGLATNNNMKRERLTTNEIEVNKNASYPLIDNMLRNRKQAVEKINKMFDLDIDVEFSSIWNGTNEDDNNGTNGDNPINNHDTSLNGGVDKPEESNQEPTSDNEPTNETQSEVEQDNQTDKKSEVEPDNQLEEKPEVENQSDENKEEDNEPTNNNDDVDKKSTDELSNDDQSNNDDDKKDKKDDDKK
ncbi:MAG: hypothetical protein Q3961_01980 [Bifidobacteriaceae bacterium]|nr:hypothetical protein [Bifidobacteriaceae bacterium]